MNTIKHTQLQTSFARLAFGQGRPDAFRMDDPRIGSSVCGITSLFGVRGPLFEDDKGGGGGGGEPAKLTMTQAELDAIIQKRVASLTEKLKAAEATAGKVAEIEKKLAEADAERDKATEAEALKGKTELEKAQHQTKKAQELIAKLESEKAKVIADHEVALTTERNQRLEVVKSAAVKDALFGAGLSTAKNADKFAAMAFLAEAEIEFAEDGKSVTKVTVGGKSFDKLADAGKHFVSENPLLAAAPAGGSGNPRGGANGAPPTTDVSKSSADDDFAIGMSKN